MDQNNLYRISQESPMERMRREIQEELEEAERYRASILQNVTTFGTFKNYILYQIYELF